MKVSELIETLQKCKPDDDVGVDMGEDVYEITFVWEDNTLGVLLCTDEMPGFEEPPEEVNECSEACNLHNSAAEI